MLTELKEGIDYTVNYKNNTKPRKDAKYTVNFTGNYKGRKKAKGEFEISTASLKDAKIKAGDMVYLGPAKLEPWMTVKLGDTVLDPGNYKVTLYKGEEDITKKAKFDDSELPATITVKVTGKKSCKDEATGSFTVNKLPEGAYNLTDAKIYAQSSNELLKKADYTGKEVEPAIDVKVKVGSEYETVPKESYTVSYLNNVERGKATIIICGDNKKAFGTKTGTFTIGVRKFDEILKLIFSGN